MVKIQARHHEGNLVRLTHRGCLLSRLENSLRFQAIWKRSLEIFDCESSQGCPCTWVELKQKHHDTVRSMDIFEEVDFTGTVTTLEAATAAILDDDGELTKEESGDESADAALSGRRTKPSSSQSQHESPDHMLAEQFGRIHLTKEVIKWLRTGDSKYRKFFIRRVKQLAMGDRSRILAKRLTGCKTPIFESYLEQKSGFRILWTKNGEQSLLIWFIAKHDNVSRLANLIDDAESRSKRQLTSAFELPEIEQARFADESAASDFLMLDPFSDTPLKLYEVHYDEIWKLKDASWKPRLHLTTNEREIVETSGTVLLLGRSGTGKTCCICNRMDYDRHLNSGDESFSQLFVARSERLCRYVKDSVDSSVDSSPGGRCKFTTFHRLVQSLESAIQGSDTAAPVFLPSQRIDFVRFKRYMWDTSSGIDALIVWTSIRSFIKGSIEALQQRRPLNKDQYLGLGKRRCRLSPEQRGDVYAEYERYEIYRKELQLYDDCDRIASLLYRIEDARQRALLAFREVCYSKIYVDEVQDYTQSEIALFFCLSGPGSLFLAGDPAQSVVEGVEFRFEEIRSVGYHLCDNASRSLIPDKPKTVNVNFRSHSGILDVAAGVLALLFGAFPNAAKQLSKDRGLFKGPRPAVFQKVGAMRLKELVYKLDGVVILTHDKETAKVKRDLDYPLVYGIREAKGLEFYAVILVDFFGDLPFHLQKPLRDLCLGRDFHNTSMKCPELEGKLKLLYTGITRCIQRLFFVETRKSVAGEGFLRWIATAPKGRSETEALAVLHTVDNVEKMTRTPDEWQSAGLDNAVMAEESDSPNGAVLYLEKAIYCFEQIGDNSLAKKASTHASTECALSL
jgi:AAA domain